MQCIAITKALHFAITQLVHNTDQSLSGQLAVGEVVDGTFAPVFETQIYFTIPGNEAATVDQLCTPQEGETMRNALMRGVAQHLRNTNRIKV